MLVIICFFLRVFWRRDPGLLSNAVAYNMANVDMFIPSVTRDVTKTTAVIIGTRFNVQTSLVSPIATVQEPDTEIQASIPTARVTINNQDDHEDSDSGSGATMESASTKLTKRRSSVMALPAGTTFMTAAGSSVAVKQPQEPVSDKQEEDVEEDALSSLKTTLPEVDQKFRYLLNDGFLLLEPGERVAAIKIGADVDRRLNDTALCSLSRPIEQLPNKVKITRLSSRAMPGVAETIDDLVIWLQHAIQKKHDMNITLSELVCDFVRDEDGNFIFLQVKAFKLSDASLVTTALWSKIFFSSSGKTDDHVDMGLVVVDEVDPRQVWRARSGRKPMSIAERTTKLREEVGDKCKLCGCSYIMGQVVQINPEDGVLGTKATIRDSILGKPSSSAKVNDVPVFGYDISVKLACTLLELYRDAQYPLGKYARNVLVGYTRTPDPTSAHASFIPEGIAGASEESMVGAEDTRNKPMGFVTACYICDEILRQKQIYISKTRDLNRVLGVPIPSVDDDLANKGDRSTGSNSNASKFLHSIAHIKKTAVQWRMLVV